MQRKIVELVIVLASSGALVLAGCDGETGDPDGGTAMDSGGGGTDSGGGGTDSGGGGTDSGGGGTDAGGTPTGCAAEAAAYCARFQECNPDGLLAAFETVAICTRVVAAGCENPADPLPDTNGLVDEDACTAARSGSCADFFAGFGPTPAGCVPLPGDLPRMGECAASTQCAIGTNPAGMMRRMYCRGAAICDTGECILSVSEGGSCGGAAGSVFCDTFDGVECRGRFSADLGMPGAGAAPLCLRVVYGGAGDGCFPGSERECGPGFRCHIGTRTCMAVLNPEQSCDIANDLCDIRRSLVCTNVAVSGAAVYVCEGPHYARIGAQCGVVTVDGRSITRLCSGYARCDTSLATPVCVALRALGEDCTLSPDNCEPGLECSSDTDTCVVPDPVDPCP